EAAVCREASGDSVAVIGKNRKLIIFALSEVPELGKGRGVILQRYKDGTLVDARAFNWKDGLTDSNGRTFTADELKEYRGSRAQRAARIFEGRKIPIVLILQKIYRTSFTAARVRRRRWRPRWRRSSFPSRS